MKKPILSVFHILVLLTFLLSGCLPTSMATTPTFTPEPTATTTPTPSPTPLPGSIVIPIETLVRGKPWLSFDKKAVPQSNFIGLNTRRPPFSNVLVRQAFAYAVDRDVIVEMALKYKTTDPTPATTLTPPLILGRDLYGEVGLNFDPQKAKDLLTQAGYSDPASFPAVRFLVSTFGDVAPGARFNMAKAIADMWQTHLGVTVEVQAIPRANFSERLTNDTPEMYWIGWVADWNDPDDFMRFLFRSDSTSNSGGFSNAQFDQLIDRAARITDPAERQALYIEAERILCEIETAIIPVFHAIVSLPIVR